MPRGWAGVYSPHVTSGLVVVWALALNGTAQEQKPLPAFPSRAEVVTLDVVVVDKQGRPVRGLAAADFTVFEDGQPQVVVAFEAVDLGAKRAEPAPTTSDLLARNAQPEAARSERAFVLVIDDLGLDSRPTIGVKKAITHWLTTQASPADEVTIVTTSGDLSWNDRVGTGREDLLGILSRVQSRKPKAQLNLSVGEAYQIVETAAGNRPIGSADPRAEGGLLARLMKRAIGAGLCSLGPDCESLVRTTAREIYDRVVRSTRAVLGSVERLSRLMGPRRGRKSIVVFSESFVRGTNRAEEEAAIRASQAANTAVYLVDAKGLVGDPFYSSEIFGVPDPVDIGAQALDGGFLDGEYLADATGGRALRNTNDLTSGLARILDESSAYYRLGYQPETAPDGRWRKLKVQVRRRKVEVRARRGYYASPGPVAAVPPSASRAAPPPAGETLRPAGLGAPILTPEATGAPASDPVLALILEKAGAYVVGYSEVFRDVVAGETYVQWNGGRRQRSRSDLVFVSTPGAIPWTCFRDVFEVDGRPVRDRESRLEKLFLAEPRASAIKKAEAIIVASAQYNLGARRTVNVPTLPLLFLHPGNQDRFRFERKGRRRFGDREAVEIALVEIARPTLVNDGEGRNVPASGRVFVDARDGVVLRTEVTLHPTYTLAHLKTDYQLHPSFGIWLPARMSEEYRDPQGRSIDTEATARYARYRRFGVTTQERVTLPPH